MRELSILSRVLSNQTWKLSFCGFLFVVGATIYKGGSNNKQKSFRQPNLKDYFTQSVNPHIYISGLTD